ncbi:major cardiolipin synthase ClsA [Clostridium oryzae]|uniref:Cardiolipin synthase n=1 Tax=Clostridium oryzae TaxID=1450648 RepID=A0A1V4I9K4_9CLOT|nr:cardiolipin synthase [Clostridium oryzae]OPJ56681.1 major cardiolipin synthase ClsA [Clostridium oryzae]
MNPVLTSIFFIYAIILITVIILERRQPEKTIAWLLIFIALPPIAIILYLFIGRNWRNMNRYVKLKLNLSQIIPIHNPVFPDGPYSPLVNLLVQNSQCCLTTNNSIKIFYSGEQKFSQLKKQLLNAKHYIHIEYYMVRDDLIGNEIKDILIRKSLEGINVRIILDKIGCMKIKAKYLKDLKRSGVEIVQYSYFLNPILRFFSTKLNYRNHRKIVIIDGIIGFMGGINIGDEYLGRGKLGFWRDTHLMITGDYVLQLQTIFIEDYLCLVKSKNQNTLNIDTISNYLATLESANGNKAMQPVKSSPNSKYPSTEQAFLKMISMAKHHLYICSPYFIPSLSILEAIKVSSLSGVDVKILFPGKYDHFIVYYASKTYLKELAACNVDIYFYNVNSFIHSKTIMIDSEICSIGSANMDIRSFQLNYEIGAIIYDREISISLEKQFLKDLRISNRVNREYWIKTPWYISVMESFYRIFSALL